MKVQEAEQFRASLVARAKRANIDTVEAVVDYLGGLIARNEQYLAYRREREIYTKYDATVERDQAALAMAIVLLESLQTTESAEQQQ